MNVIEFGEQNQEVVLLLHKTIPGSELEILSGLRHGDLSINHPLRYVRIIREWIENNEVREWH